MTNEEIALEIIKNIPCGINKTIGELKQMTNKDNGEIVAFDVDTSFKIIERALKEYRVYKRAFELTIEETANEMNEDEKEFEEKMLERASGLYVGFDDNSLHDSQTISPNVVEKIDKLEKENKLLKVIRFELEKKLAITDKALDKACEKLEIYAPVKKEETEHTCSYEMKTRYGWKDYLLKESEKE